MCPSKAMAKGSVLSEVLARCQPAGQRDGKAVGDRHPGTLSGWAICPEVQHLQLRLRARTGQLGLLDNHSRFRMQMKIQRIFSKSTVVAESWEWPWRASRAPSLFDSIIEQVRSRVREKSSGFKPSALFPSKVKPFAASNHLYDIPLQ